MVVIKDRSSIFLPKAVNFFWTKHCHTPVDSSPHNDVHFQDTCLNSVDYLVTYEVCTATYIICSCESDEDGTSEDSSLWGQCSFNS